MNIEQTQEGELMANRVRSIVLSVGFLFIMAGAADARSIFVDKASLAAPQDGSVTKPFRTITEALVLARQIRFGSPGQSQSNETINVHVAPETYVGVFGAATSTSSPDPREALPLILNVPNLKLQGALRFPSDESLDEESKTILRASTAQSEKQYLVVVTRTKPTTDVDFPTSLVMAGDNVTICGFLFEGIADDGSRPNPLVSPGTALVSIDGISGFLVSGNLFTHAGSFGITTRLASGRIANNDFVENIGVGINVTAGSVSFPATVEVIGNHVRNNGKGGIGLQGAAQTEKDADLFTAQKFQRFPRLPQFYDRVNLPDEVPDKLDVSVKGNDVSGNGGFGIHVNGYIRDYYTLGPTDPGDLTATVRARFVGNISRSNGNYGIVVAAGQIKLPKRQKYTVNLDVSFESTTLALNGTGPAYFGFWRFATAADFREESDLTFKLAHDSTIAICGDVTQFSFDNRAVDPTDNTATNNELTVNTMPLTGFCLPTRDCTFRMRLIPCH